MKWHLQWAMVRGAAQARALAAPEGIAERLTELTMPVLALWGAEDALVPPAVGRLLTDALPNVQFHQLTGCGHL